MFIKRKVLEELINLNKSIIAKLSTNPVTPKQMTPELITLDAQIKAANARMQIGKNSEGVDFEREYAESVYTTIQNNQIPKEYSWAYYKEIMNIALIWLNRYTNFTTTVHNKEEIINAIFACILYGMSAYNIKEKKAYFVSYQDGKYWGYPIKNIYQQDFFQYKKKGWDVNTAYSSFRKTLNKSDITLFQWQMGKMGIFVWYLQDLLKYLVAEDIFDLNINALGATLMVEVKDKEAFKKQLRHLLNPRILVKTFVLNDSNDMNRLQNISPEVVAHCETLMNSLRFKKEEMFNKWGIKITSAKSQSLSSDANLSASISATVAQEHDRRIKESLEDLGIELYIYEPEVVKGNNENADKHGEGETNTEAYLNERRSE